jgi:HK97 family phage portal protein
VRTTDEAFAQFLGIGGLVDLRGAQVTEASATGLSAIFRAVSLISGTLASLPLRTLRERDGGGTEQVASVFDAPDGPDGQTQFEWTETLFAHLVIHGRAGALKMRTEAGGLARLPLVHPASWTIEDPTDDESPVGGRWFRVQLDQGRSVRLDATDFWYVPALSFDGVRGQGLLQVARGSVSASIAGDRAAAKMFSSGALISGLASPEDDLETDETKEIKRQLDAGLHGYDNAGKIVLVNRRLKFTPWTMSAVDAQFLQSRQFQIEEIARWTGVPPHLLMQTEKQTSWGTGVEEQQRAMGRTVLAPWACRLEGRGSRLLANPRRLEIDFSGLERPSPDREIEIDLSQVAAGVMTVEEYRAKRGWKPLPAPTPPAPPADPEGGPDAPPTE